MVGHNASARAIRNNRRKYVPAEEEFLGVNMQGRIVGLVALEKMLRRVDEFCRERKFSEQLFVDFCDGGDCVAADMNEVVYFLKKDAANIDRLDIYYEKTGESGKYVVKNTTLAALKCEVTNEKFAISAHSADSKAVDFSPLLESLKKTIDHLPKKFDRFMQNRQKSVAKIGLAIGLLAALLVTALPMLDVRGREFYLNHVITYLIVTLIVAVILGFIAVGLFVIPLYNELLSGTQNEESCDVTIGRKINFAKYRKILVLLDRAANYLLIGGLILLALMPIIMIWCF